MSESATHAVRITVPGAAELRSDVAELLPLIAQPGREPARTMAVLARQPELLTPFLGWAAAPVKPANAADELHTDRDVSDATWTVLAEHYDAPALVEILFVVGQYTMLSMVANAAGIPA